MRRSASSSFKMCWSVIGQSARAVSRLKVYVKIRFNEAIVNPDAPELWDEDQHVVMAPVGEEPHTVTNARTGEHLLSSMSEVLGIICSGCTLR